MISTAILSDTMIEDTKKELPQVLINLLGHLKAGDSIRINVRRGADEVTQPGENIERYEINDTWTFSVEVNGGATDRAEVGFHRFIAQRLARED